MFDYFKKRVSRAEYQPLFKKQEPIDLKKAEILPDHTHQIGFYVFVNTMKRKAPLLITTTQEQINQLRKTLQNNSEASSTYQVRELINKVINDIEMAVACMNTMKVRLISGIANEIRKDSAYQAAWKFLEEQHTAFVTLLHEATDIKEEASERFKSCYAPL